MQLAKGREKKKEEQEEQIQDQSDRKTIDAVVEIVKLMNQEAAGKSDNGRLNHLLKSEQDFRESLLQRVNSLEESKAQLEQEKRDLREKHLSLKEKYGKLCMIFDQCQDNECPYLKTSFEAEEND